jgi:hypothetical protein
LSILLLLLSSLFLLAAARRRGDRLREMMHTSISIVWLLHRLLIRTRCARVDRRGDGRGRSGMTRQAGGEGGQTRRMRSICCVRDCIRATLRSLSFSLATT